MLGRKKRQQETRSNNGFNRGVFGFRRLTCSFSVTSRVMTTSQVERKSFQEVGWIHGYVCFFVCGPTAAPQDPGCNRLCLSSVFTDSRTLGFQVWPQPLPCLFSPHSSLIPSVFLIALSPTSAHVRTQVGQLV